VINRKIKEAEEKARNRLRVDEQKQKKVEELKQAKEANEKFNYRQADWVNNAKNEEGKQEENSRAASQSISIFSEGYSSQVGNNTRGRMEIYQKRESSSQEAELYANNQLVCPYKEISFMKSFEWSTPEYQVEECRRAIQEKGFIYFMDWFRFKFSQMVRACLAKKRKKKKKIGRINTFF